MQFGIFDHVDRNDRPLAAQLDERIHYVALAEGLATASSSPSIMPRRSTWCRCPGFSSLRLFAREVRPAFRK
jgi:hypothetical protein